MKNRDSMVENDNKKLSNLLTDKTLQTYLSDYERLSNTSPLSKRSTENTYFLSIEKLPNIQAGYFKWQQLWNQVQEQDAMIRSRYDKKTLKLYDSSFKKGMKNVNLVPHIIDAATAEAECDPLEQVVKMQEQFINSVSHNASGK